MKRAERKKILAEHWRSDKVRRSRGPADNASIAFDDVRRVIQKDGDPRRRANRWERLTKVLDEFRADLEVGNRQ